MKKKTKFQLKKDAEALQTLKCASALARAKSCQKAAQLKGSKRKDVEFLTQYLASGACVKNAVRHDEHFVSRSYNMSRQVMALVEHRYVKYATPEFLYRPMLSAKGRALLFEEKFRNPINRHESRLIEFEQDIFLAAAQGRSVTKLLKDVLTKAEVFAFMQAPRLNTVPENVLWAKAVAAGANPAVAQFVVDKFDVAALKLVGDRLPDLLRFYACHGSSLDKYALAEVTDYIRHVVLQKDFSFKGRTAASMLALTCEWHRTFYAGVVGKYQSWKATYPLWSIDLKVGRVDVIELTNNRALADEGKRQHHCVYTYVRRCLEGHSRIVSFRWFVDDILASRLTVEVSPRTNSVIQARGRLNREISAEEHKTVAKWSRAHGLKEVSQWEIY